MRLRELGEERGDGGPDIGARIAARLRWGCDGVLKGLGRLEPVQESLYAICGL